MKVCLGWALAAALLAGARAEEPVQVMVIGTMHWSNANQDKLNIAVDDVLAPKRQAEIAALNDALAKFAPTAVAVEWPAETVAERYPKFLAGTLDPSRNEVVQLGFRLAQTMKLETVHGIDAEGEFPFDAVAAYADAHGQKAVLDAQWAALEAQVADIQSAVNTLSLGAVLRLINEPARVASDHGFYRGLLRIGGGNDQPGAELLGAWYLRNARTCAKLVQLAKQGDRIVVLFGSGHAYLLRQCVTETPGFVLVEPRDFLPG